MAAPGLRSENVSVIHVLGVLNLTTERKGLLPEAFAAVERCQVWPGHPVSQSGGGH